MRTFLNQHRPWFCDLLTARPGGNQPYAFIILADLRLFLDRLATERLESNFGGVNHHERFSSLATETFNDLAFFAFVFGICFHFIVSN